MGHGKRNSGSLNLGRSRYSGRYLSKAIGVLGGYAGGPQLIDYLVRKRLAVHLCPLPLQRRYGAGMLIEQPETR